MTLSRFVPWMAAAALVSAGCSDSSDSSESRLREFAAAYADTFCSALVDCSCTDRAGLEDCKASYREIIFVMAAQELTYAPSRALDPTAASTCLTDLRQAVQGCPGPSAEEYGITRSGLELLTQSCAGDLLFVGTQGEGDYCTSRHDCAPELDCDDLARACVPRGGVGADCSNIGCLAGLSCDGSDTCAAPPGAGAPCPDAVCGDGARCVWVEETATDTCLLPHAVDASCADGAGCVSGAYCDAGTCRSFLADGEDCSGGGVCLHGWCNEGTCTDPGFCAHFGFK